MLGGVLILYPSKLYTYIIIDAELGRYSITLDLERIEPNILGELLHTALRKLCDSTASSIAWDAWNDVVDEYPEIANGITTFLSSKIKKANLSNYSDLVDVVSNNWIDQAQQFYYDSRSEAKKKLCRNLWLALKNLSDKDWFGVVGYLVQNTN